MEITIIYGSVRTARQGIKAARFIERKLQERGHSTTLLDPQELQLPLLDKMYKEFDTGQAPKNLQRTHEVLAKADGFVVVSGEYNHSVPPALSNLIDHFLQEFFFKPSAIVTYSSGSFGGVRAGCQLRALLGEVGMPSIPSMFPVSKVQEFQEDGTPHDDAYQRRVQKFLDEFEWYLRALKAARDKGTPY